MPTAYMSVAAVRFFVSRYSGAALRSTDRSETYDVGVHNSAESLANPFSTH